MKRRTLAVIAGLYVVEGFPAALFADPWHVYWRESGVPLAAIGWLSGLSVAFGLKVLWAPLVDRYGGRQVWIAAAELVLAAALLALAALDPAAAPRALFALVAIACLASATQDIAIDAYSIGLTAAGEEGPVNAARVAAFRTALLVFGGGVLVVAGTLGWPVTHRLLALVAVGFAALSLATPRLALPPPERRGLRHAFAGWRARGELPAVLGFVLWFRLPDVAMSPMVAPFWVDGGISREEIGLVKSAIGFGATLAGAAIGGAIVRWRGIPASLWIGGLAAVASNFAYAAAAAAGGGRLPIFAASTLESACSGLAAVAFMSFLMRICERDHAAVQYAALTSIGLLGGSLARFGSGVVAEQVGYAAFFALTGLVALPAFLWLPAAARWAREPRSA